MLLRFLSECNIRRRAKQDFVCKAHARRGLRTCALLRCPKFVVRLATHKFRPLPLLIARFICHRQRSQTSPLPPQDAPSRDIAFFDYFCVLFSPKTVLLCALVSIISAQSKPNYGQTCGQNRAGSGRKIFTAKREANNDKINIVFITRVTNKMWHGL